MKPPSGPKKTNPNKAKTNPISNPVLSAACPERSRMGRMGQFLQRPKSLAKKSGYTHGSLVEG